MSDPRLDSFEHTLEEKLKELKSCQQNKQKTSCSECEKILDCELRKSYVKAVYNSMNKGTSGDFSF